MVNRIAVALLTILLLGVAPASAQPAAGGPTVTVGVAPSIDMSLMIIAVKKGFLQKQGLNAQLQLFDSAPAALQGVVAGRAARSWSR